IEPIVPALRKYRRSGASQLLKVHLLWPPLALMAQVYGRPIWTSTGTRFSKIESLFHATYGLNNQERAMRCAPQSRFYGQTSSFMGNCPLLGKAI
ncbi:MAG: hypothetical protein WCA52_03250, partial [Candidatus Aquilonibacter sp.]